MQPGLSEDPEAKQVISKTEQVLIDVITKELTEEEMYHFIESLNHTLQMSAKRYAEINTKIYNQVTNAIKDM